MKRHPKFPGRPLPYIPPPPPNSYLHLQPVVVNRIAASTDLEHVHAINETIRICNARARAARDEALAAGAEGAALLEAISEAYIAALPDMDVIVNVRCFIAAVAAGVKRGYIVGPQARLLLYTAQLQLAAMTRRVQ